MRIALVLSILALAGCRSVQPAAPAPQHAAPTRSASAVQAMDDATQAVAGWRQELVQGERLDDSALLELRSADQRLRQELGALLRQVEVRDAAFRVDARRTAPLVFARGDALTWVDALRDTAPGAAERRENALAEMRAALGHEPTPPASTDEHGGPVPLPGTSASARRRLAALIALQLVRDVPFDGEPFRPLLLPVARKATGPELVAALDALDATARRPEDLELVQDAWARAPGDLGDDTLRLLERFGDGRIEGRSEEIALACLADIDGRRANQRLHGLWGARVGPRLEARLLELSRSTDPQLRHAAIYFGLSTLSAKSEAVVDALIETLADPDAGNWDRALWGLGQGVPDSLQPKVAAALVELHNSRTDEAVRERCAELVARYGGPEYTAELER